MDQREAEGHYGTRLFIFQCPECSGIWLDGEVAGAISHDSALEAEVDVDFADISIEPRNMPEFCPRCETYLTEQTGDGLPEGLHVDYCKSCNGLWFDKGELMIYKGYMEQRRKRFMREQQEKRKKEL